MDTSLHGVCPQNDSVVMPDCVNFLRFGLGRGVDASEPSPLSSATHQQEVRSILPCLSNIHEKTALKKFTYEETISSLNSHKLSVTASVSDIVGKMVTYQAEAEYMRQMATEMHIAGEQLQNGYVHL